MAKFEEIGLSWRSKRGERRYIVARLTRGGEGGINFKYDEKEFGLARAKGLDFFPGFRTPEKLTPQQIQYLLALRVMQEGHASYTAFKDFWEIGDNLDVFELLAFTQGKSPTDNFEFLALYKADKNLAFVTDIAGLTSIKLDKDIVKVKVNDRLRVELEKNNPDDPDAVAVYKNDLKIGYIKRCHNLAFIGKSGYKSSLRVRHVEQDEKFIRDIFVKVKFNKEVINFNTRLPENKSVISK
jgi:hypothetical protein